MGELGCPLVACMCVLLYTFCAHFTHVNVTYIVKMCIQWQSIVTYLRLSPQSPSSPQVCPTRHT